MLADEWNLSREALDAYSYESHRRAIAAIDEGRFEREIVPIEVSTQSRRCSGRELVPVGEAGLRPAGAHADEGASASVKEGVHGGTMGSPVLKPHCSLDETPRRDTSLEKLAELPTAFKPDGVVTAGSSSQICDGAAAMLIVSEDAASRLDLEPRARFVSFGLAGVDPYRMLHGNPQACERALAKAGLSWDDMSVIEVNEAFASVVLQFLADTGLEERWRRGRRQPERRRHLARPSSGSDRCAHHCDAAVRARAA